MSREVAIDIYPFKNGDDVNGWQFELARDRLAWGLLTEPNSRSLSCNGIKALSVPSLTQAPTDDAAVLWLATDVEQKELPLQLSGNTKSFLWSRRHLHGFASGSVIEWTDEKDKRKHKAFEIDNLCGGDSETILLQLLAAIEDYVDKESVASQISTQQMGQQPGGAFYRQQGYEVDDSNPVWLTKYLGNKTKTKPKHKKR